MKPTTAYRIARLRDALLLTLCSAAATLAVIIAILMAWNMDVVDTFLGGGSLPWLIGSCVVALAGWIVFALQRPPGPPEEIR